MFPDNMFPDAMFSDAMFPDAMFPDAMLAYNSLSKMINVAPRLHTMLVAAGRGSRFGSSIPKQYLKIHEQTLLQLSVARLASSKYIDSCFLIVAADDTIASTLDFRLPISYVRGGAERWQSVRAGVDAIFAAGAAADDLILIHDAARPAVPTDDIDQVIETAMQEQYGAILATPVADTLKQAQTYATEQTRIKGSSIALPYKHPAAYALRTIDRTDVWQAQTPQVFRAQALRDVLAHVAKHRLDITDEASAFEQLYWPIRLVTGSRQNIKLTYPDDAVLIAAILAAQK